MNKNASKLYEDLKAGRLEVFDMRRVHDCGTPNCLLGHALYRMSMLENFREEDSCVNAKTYTRSKFDSTKAAYDWLGLTEEKGNELCFPVQGYKTEVWRDEAIADATQQQAAEALRRACELSDGKEG